MSIAVSAMRQLRVLSRVIVSKLVAPFAVAIEVNTVRSFRSTIYMWT